MNEPKPKGNTAVRLATSAPWVVLIIYMLFYGPAWLFPLVVGGVTAACALELFAMTTPDSAMLRAQGVLATVGIYTAVCLRPEADTLLLAVTATVVVGMLANLTKPEPIGTAASRIAWSIAGPLYIGGLMALLVRLFDHEHGGAWTMLALTSAFLSDTGGYFAGRAFGKHKLAPLVSPKKTWEGTFGGLGGALVGALVAHFGYLPSVPLHHAVIGALLAAAIGQAGDLCESLIKRSTGVKDSGNTLPGHGGFLDRSDAMMFSGAVLWAYRTLAM